MSADFTPEKEDYKILPPFKMQVLTNFPYIEADFDALTNYQLLCKVVEYLNGVIYNENEVTEQVLGLYNAYVSLQNYVNNYFDNLDIQEEVNNKLDEMVESGVLEQIIEQFIQSTALWCFNNVEEMKEATNLINGSYAKTLGYYEENDGGGAIYKITNTASLTDYQEELDSGLYATLIINSYVTPEMFGAYGDNTHDDSTPIQLALNKNKNVILTKNYKISNTIEIKDTENINIKAEKSTINYNGNDSAILIYHLNGGNINFGTINSTNGNGIELRSTNGTNDRIMYVNLSFVRLTCNGKNIYVNISNNGYINEITLKGGQITDGDYGLYFVNSNNEVSGCNGWRIENIGFEGCDNCLYYNASNSGRFMGHIINNIRYIENTTATVLETHGQFYRCKLISWGNLVESRLLLDYQYLTDFEIIAPIYNEELTSVIATGIYYNGTRKRYLNERTIKETLTGNTHLTSGTITLFKINNLVIISFADIIVDGTTTISIIDENGNPYPPNVFTGAFNSVLTNGSADHFGRLLVRTNGSIAVKVDDKTQSYSGEIVYYTDVANVSIS